MNKIYKISISGVEVNEGFLQELETDVKHIEENIGSVSAKRTKSIGLSGGEEILTLVVSFVTSIAANLTYDLGKEIVNKLKSKGGDAEILLEEE